MSHIENKISNQPTNQSGHEGMGIFSTFDSQIIYTGQSYNM